MIEHLPIEGKIITDVIYSQEEITLICGDEAFRMYHSQDCCECVMVYDVSDDISKLIGSRVVLATQNILQDWPGDIKYNPFDSYTWTIFRFVNESGVDITVRWLGTSNGFYSESVYFSHTHVPIALKD